MFSRELSKKSIMYKLAQNRKIKYATISSNQGFLLINETSPNNKMYFYGFILTKIGYFIHQQVYKPLGIDMMIKLKWKVIRMNMYGKELKSISGWLKCLAVVYIIKAVTWEGREVF